MKDIDEVPNQTHSIMSAAWVWQLELEVCMYLLNGPQAGLEGRARTYPQQHHPVPSRRPILQESWTDHQKSTNNANSRAQAGQHQKEHNNVNDIPPHPHHNHTARGWTKSTSPQSTTFHTLTMPPLQPECAHHCPP